MAACTIALQSATNNCLKYLVTGNDTDTLNLDATDAATPNLARDTIASTNLRNLLTTTVAAIANARAIIYGSKIEISTQDEDVGKLQVYVDVDAAVPQKIRLTITCIDTVRSILCIKFRTSFGR